VRKRNFQNNLNCSFYICRKHSKFMTCIVGLIHKGEVHLAGDSAGVAGLSISIRADKKVFVNKKFVMGFTSSFRMGQLLQYSFKPPVHKKGVPDMEYMVTSFVTAIRKCFKDHGFGHMTEGRDNSGGTFLVGYNGRLYRIESDFQVGETFVPYEAVGCGSDIALGALFALSGVIMEPEDRLQLALEAASKFSAGVEAPYNFVKLPKPNGRRSNS
jgi:20S proteasome alpha/beta subunit